MGRLLSSGCCGLCYIYGCIRGNLLSLWSLKDGTLLFLFLAFLIDKFPIGCTKKMNREYFTAINWKQDVFNHMPLPSPVGNLKWHVDYKIVSLWQYITFMSFGIQNIPPWLSFVYYLLETYSGVLTLITLLAHTKDLQSCWNGHSSCLCFSLYKFLFTDCGYLEFHMEVFLVPYLFCMSITYMVSHAGMGGLTAIL